MGTNKKRVYHTVSLDRDYRIKKSRHRQNVGVNVNKNKSRYRAAKDD